MKQYFFEESKQQRSSSFKDVQRKNFQTELKGRVHGSGKRKNNEDYQEL